MKKANRLTGIFALTFLIAMILVAFYKRHLLLHDFEYTTGRVTTITGPGWKGSGDFSILYEYNVKGKLYKANSNYKFCGSLSMKMLRPLLVGKQFPVAFAAKDRSTGTLLLTQENADRFKYTLPDSVRFYDSILTCK